MDFGLDFVGIEGLVVPQSTAPASGSIKQERSDPYEDEGNRAPKMAKRADDLGLISNDGSLPKEQMLSFSSSTKPEVSFLSGKDVGLISEKNAQNLGLSYYQQSAYSRTPTGFGPGNMNGGMRLHGSFTGIRGPFTPAQWIELEHQAMIFKYLIANIPVPANLLVPIRKALSSSGFPGFSVGSYPSHSYGWGSFHLGFSGSTDPEPGRCRRTDGKKWRCSRDAVPDQKYCERHINRGRHRSRKLVEGHTSQAASGPTSTKGMPVMSASMSSLVTYSGGASNSVTIAQDHIKGLRPAGATNASTDPMVNRFHDQQGLTVMPATLNLKSKDSPFSVLKQNIPLGESSQAEFGLSQDQYPVRDFMAEDLKSDWTQLSMSIPMSCDFSSFSSPTQGKIASSPIRLSCELEQSQMGSGFGPIVGEIGTKQNARIPVPWGNSMGGPLGEVLNNAGNAMGICEAENQKAEGWDGSPQLGSSPTGVLQKSTFVSLSNSSSGDSPTGENKKTQEGATVCDGLVSAAHGSSTIPSCNC